jgi:hypothetical protein
MKGALTNSIGTGGVITALTLLVWVPTAAQVTRVEDGHALDANYRVGSGGYNTPRPASGYDSQLYITGQVTGLSRFHGDVGYTAADQLRLRLPSSSLESFQQRSVGVQDVIGGEAHLPSSYFNRTQTTASIAKIASGEVTPGAAIPRPTTLAPLVAGKLYSDATADYGSIAVLKPEEISSATPMVRPPAGIGLDAGRTRSDFSQDSETDLRSSLRRFGIPRPGGEEKPATSGGDGTRRETSIDLRIDTAVESRAPGAAVPAAPLQAGQTTTRPATGLMTMPESEILEKLTYESNQDVFVDMLVRLNELRTGRKLPESTGFVGKWAQDKSASEGDKGKQRVVEIVDKGVVVHSLAGRFRNPLNIRLELAEEKLKAGKFYEAAAAYEAAIETAPANPLPRIGVAISLFVAGEPYIAATQVRQAMELLPPVMETHVDIAKILGPQIETWKIRKLALDARVEESPSGDAMLRFLAVYVHQQSGEPGAAKSHASKLNEAAKDDKVLSTYATLVLTGRKPVESQTRPAASEKK